MRSIRLLLLRTMKTAIIVVFTREEALISVMMSTTSLVRALCTEKTAKITTVSRNVVVLCHSTLHRTGEKTVKTSTSTRI